MSDANTLTPPKKHITTVAEFYTDDLDEKVNDLIDNGYTLIEREVITPNNELEKSYFYAELEKLFSIKLDRNCCM